MDKMREEFEAWVSECSPIKAEFKDGSYSDAMIEMTWIVWQASRKALVVELPVVESAEKRSNGIIEELRCYRDHNVKRALDAAGVAYK